MKTSAMARPWLGLWAAACLLASLGVGAEPGTPWHALTPEQRQLLQKAQEERWNAMPAERQQRMLEGIERWQEMSPEERARIRQKREKFQALSPEERAQLRERHHRRHEAIDRLPPEEQQRLRECWRQKRAGADPGCEGLLPLPPAPPGGD